MGLPELYRVALGIAQLCEPAVRVHLGVDVDDDAARAQLSHHAVKVGHPEVDPPTGRSEVRAVLMLLTEGRQLVGTDRWTPRPPDLC